jgi:alpha-glucosidase
MRPIDFIKTLRFMGWENPYRAIAYSILRDRFDRRLKPAQREPSRVWLSPGELLSVNPTTHGAEFLFERSHLEIDFLAEDVVRVSWQPGEPPVPYAIQEHYWPGFKPTLTAQGQTRILSAGDTRVNISKDGKLTWLRGGRVIRTDVEPLHRQGSWRHGTLLSEPGAAFGLGGRTQHLNLRPGAYQLWNHDPGGSYGRGDDPLYLNVPTLLIVQQGACYLVFYENSYAGEVTIDDQLSVQFEGGMLRYYLLFGDLARIFDSYTDLTGKPSLPPRWALGFHQSRWGYRSEDDIKMVLDGFRKHDLPISAIHLDIDYMDGYRVFTIDPHSFPNVLALSEQAENQGVKLVSILNPGVKIDRGYRLYRDGIQQEIFCKLPNDRALRAPVWPGWVHFPDFTDPDTRLWWRSKYPQLLRNGIAGIWHDMNEPAAFTAWGDPTLPLSAQHKLEGKGGHHRQAHNVYGLLMNRAGYEALREFQPEKRPFILSRSGWAGNQRFAWNWTGDVESSWEGLKVSLNVMLGMSMSGILFTGSDIGGFSGDPSPELMLRWMQLAVFTPFFRVHSALTSSRREIWRFDNPYREAMRRTLQLRYQLLPYLYTLAWQAKAYGLPLMRPYFWEDPGTLSSWDVEDQFFLGPNLLIAPVMDAGVVEREISLPDGLWHSFWDEASFQGPAQIKLSTSADHIPVFVRAGSVLPLKAEHLELHIYPGASQATEHMLYSDEGDGYGPYRIDRFRMIPSEQGIEIERSAEGDYPFPYQQTEIHWHADRPRSIMIDGRESDRNSTPLQIKDFTSLRFDFSNS